jgi:hypothetical protein
MRSPVQKHIEFRIGFLQFVRPPHDTKFKILVHFLDRVVLRRERVSIRTQFFIDGLDLIVSLYQQVIVFLLPFVISIDHKCQYEQEQDDQRSCFDHSISVGRLLLL